MNKQLKPCRVFKDAIRERRIIAKIRAEIEEAKKKKEESK